MKYLLLRHIGAALFSYGSVFYVVPLMQRIAYKWGIIDYPDGVIKLHERGVPYLGGLAVYIGFIAGLGIFYPFQNSVLWLLMGSTLLLFLGLIDDLLALKHYQKALGQIIASLCFLKGGIALKADFFSYNFNIFMTIFWIFLLVNAFNLIDVMDGLCCIVAISSSLFFFIVALLTHNYELTLLLITFIGSLCAFLWYNKPSAQIYLGDCGALFIGGFLAVIPFFFSWGTFSSYGYLAPLTFLGLPLFEVGLLVLLRTKEGIPFYRGSPHHFSLLLQKSYHKSVVLALTLGINILLGCQALFFLYGVIGEYALVMTGGGTLFFLMVFVLRRGYLPSLKEKRQPSS